MSDQSKIVGADGKPMKTVTLPTVKFRDFQFSFQAFSKEDVATKKNGGLRPGDLVREYRARCKELEDRIQILTAILCVSISEGPEAGKEFLKSIGARVVDLNNKVIFDSEA